MTSSYDLIVTDNFFVLFILTGIAQFESEAEAQATTKIEGQLQLHQIGLNKRDLSPEGSHALRSTQVAPTPCPGRHHQGGDRGLGVLRHAAADQPA